MSGPAQWTQAILTGPDVPPLVLNGVAVEATIANASQSIPEQGVYVLNSGGQGIHHGLHIAQGAPIAMGPWEGDIEVNLDSEDIRALLLRAPALARVGTLEVWLHRWIVDAWVGDGSKTTFGLSRQTGYGSTGVAWADAPARAYDNGTELTMVTGTPGAGECQLSQSADATQIVVGTAPSAGNLLELRYYPVMIGSAGYSEQFTDFNNGAGTLEFREFIPARSYP